VVAFLRAAQPFLEIMLYSDMFMGEERSYDWEKGAETVNIRSAKPVLLMKFAEGKLDDSAEANKAELLEGAINVINVTTAVTMHAQAKAASQKRRDELVASLKEQEQDEVRPPALRVGLHV
jgi:hypothetical protein